VTQPTTKRVGRRPRASRMLSLGSQPQCLPSLPHATPAPLPLTLGSPPLPSLALQHADARRFADPESLARGARGRASCLRTTPTPNAHTRHAHPPWPTRAQPATMSLQLRTCPTLSLSSLRTSLFIHSESGLSACSRHGASSLRVAHERTALGSSCASSVSAPLASLHGQRPFAQGIAPFPSTHLSLGLSCPPLTLPSDAQIPLDDVEASRWHALNSCRRPSHVSPRAPQLGCWPIPTRAIPRPQRVSWLSWEAQPYRASHSEQ